MVARRQQQDGLPPGWTVQLKQMRSGRTIRYFINSQTGQKFSSEEDLIRYIKVKSTLTSQNEDPQTNKKHVERQSENIDVQVIKKTNEEWLPEGWKVETKTRNSGSSSGTKYKCYIDPSTGSKFYSKPEVFRYLKGVMPVKHQSCSSNQKKAGSAVHSASKVVIVNSEVTDLPRGWIKELKIKTVENRVRKDPYYTDLATGYVFRSKKDVLRYLETGKISKYAFLPQKRVNNDTELIDNKSSASCATKRQKLKHPASILQPSTGMQSSDRSGLAVPVNEASKKMLRRRGSGFPVALTVETLSEKASVEKQNDHYACPSTNYETVSTPAYDLKGKSSLNSGMEKSSRSSNISGKSNKKKWHNLPRRSSKRLAGIHPVLPTVKLSETNQQDSTPIGDRAVSNSVSDLLGMDSLELGVEKSSSRSRNTSGKTNKKEGLVLPRRFSERLSGLKTVLPKVEFSKTNQQKITWSGDKAFNSSAYLIGKNSLESEMQKGNNSSRNNSGKSNKKGRLDLPRRSSKRLAGLKTALPEVELLEANQQEIPLSDNKAVLNSTSELMTKNSLEKGLEKGNSKRSNNNSGKSKKKSRFDVPRRSSKRLVRGFKADMSKNSSSSEQVPQNAVMVSENEVVPAVGFTLNSVADEGSGQFEARPITELARRAFSVESIPSVGELLNKSQKSLDEQVIPTEPFQTLEAEKSNYEKSDFRFGDPCLQFAFKTLAAAGAMPLEDAVANMPISTCTVDILHEKNLHDGKMGKSCNKKFWTDVGGTKDKKELTMPCWSFKQTALLQNELAGGSARQISAGKSCQTEPNLDFDLAVDNLPNGASQKLNSGPEMGLASHDSLQPNAPLHEGPSKSNQILKDQIVTEEEPRPIESEKVNGDKSVSQVVFPSGDYWSDPCLEFAFKTLTGAIPLDNFAIPDYPQPQLDTFHKERDGNLAPPDFGLPSHFHSDISSQFDASERQPGTGQQLPLNPSVPAPPGNKSLPSCGAVGAQQPFMEQNKDIQGKVSS